MEQLEAIVMAVSFLVSFTLTALWIRRQRAQQ